MFTAQVAIAYAADIVGVMRCFVLALIATFKLNTARMFAIPYALFEGVFLGEISVVF